MFRGVDAIASIDVLTWTKPNVIITEFVWQATVKYIDGRTDTFLVKNPYNAEQTKPKKDPEQKDFVKRDRCLRFRTRTGLLQSGIFPIKQAHYIAFCQGGFAIKNVELRSVKIQYRLKDKAVRVL